MSKKHTPEPWQYTYEHGRWEAWHEPQEGGSFKYPFQCSREANAKRIVECVNALEGVENPSGWRNIQVERIKENLSLKERIKDLTDLLTNLEEILESGNSIKPTSIIRSAMQIAIGKTNAGSISNH